MPKLNKSVKVTLRNRSISKGRISYYLDFYPPITHPESGKSTRRFSLGIYKYENPKNQVERNHNNDTKSDVNKKFTLVNQMVIDGDYSFLGISDDDFIKFCRVEAQNKLRIGRKERSIFGDTTAINHIEKMEGKIPMETADHNLIQRFRDYLLDKDTYINTIMLYESKITKYIDLAYHKGKIDRPYRKKALPELKPEEVEKVYLTKDELQNLISTPAMNNEVKRACLLSYFTTLRIAQVLALTTDNINRDNPEDIYLDFKIAKTGKFHKVPLSDDALFLLGNPEGKKIFTQPYDNRFSKEIRKWADAAGVEKYLTAHIFRRTGINDYANESALDIAQRLAGHAKITTTQIYAGTDYSRIREAVNNRSTNIWNSYDSNSN